MQNWLSQIIIGVIVTVIGTVVAHHIIKGGKGFLGGGYHGSSRGGR